MIVFSYPITFFLFVLIGNLLGWYYTAPPLQLSYHGLGEIGTMIAVGLLIPGLGYFALTRQINTAYLPLMLPLMSQGFALSLYLEIPDREADLQGHKNTFVVRYGVSFGLLIAFVFSFFSSLWFLLYGFLHIISDGINYWLVGGISLLPLFFSFLGLIQYNIDSTKVRPITFRVTGAFFVFYILLIAYFLIVIFQ